jgi:signal transduction histidine kinase
MERRTSRPVGRRTDRRSRRFWGALIFGWWTLNGFATASQYHLFSGMRDAAMTWSQTLITSMASAYLWVPVTFFALWSSWRFPLDREHWARRLPLHAGAAAAVVFFRAGAVVALNGWIGWYAELPPFTRVLGANFATNASLYWMLVGAAHAVHYAEAYRRREQDAEKLRTELVRAELEALRARLQPHFLFNALNTISSMIAGRPEAAERMVARLGELLRYSLDRDGTEAVELREELELVASYLAIEEARFEDRLRVQWSIDPATLPARVPPLLLQPIVENAVRHGISPRSEPGRIEIVAERVDGMLRLVVRDDGVGLPADGVRTGRDGLGLKSTRTRLERLYGDRHGFRIDPAPGGGVIVELTIPFRVAAPSGGGSRCGESAKGPAPGDVAAAGGAPFGNGAPPGGATVPPVTAHATSGGRGMAREE